MTPRVRDILRVLAVALLLAVLAPPVLAKDDSAYGGSGKSQRASETEPELTPEQQAKQQRLFELNIERQKKQRKFVLRSRTGRLLNAAVSAMDEEKPAEATEILSKLSVDRLNPFERARTYLIRAHAAYAGGSPEAAIENFRNAIATEALQIPEEAGLRFNVAQLLAGQQNWAEVVNAILEWHEYTVEPTPISYYLLGVAYYQTEKLDKALEAAETAVDLSDNPKEGWLTLLAALYVQRENYDKAIPIFERLVLRYPKKQYWVQLSLLWGAKENFRHALAVQQMAFEQGLLDDGKELVRLARSYLYHELPYPAAKVLQEGMDDGTIEADVKNLELLANAWIAAREYEKSLAPLTRAAELAEDGNLFVRLGQVYMQRENWEQASALLQRAIDKGGLDDVGNARLLLGISYYNDQRLARATAMFNLAKKFEKQRRAAEGWITHIARETQSSETGG